MYYEITIVVKVEANSAKEAQADTEQVLQLPSFAKVVSVKEY